MKLDTIRRQAMAMEAVTEEPHHDFSSFRVRGKIFLTVPPDGEHLHAFVPFALQDEAVTLHPEWIEKLMWGDKALGVRIHLPRADAAVVERLVSAAYAARVAMDARPRRR